MLSREEEGGAPSATADDEPRSAPTQPLLPASSLPPGVEEDGCSIFFFRGSHLFYRCGRYELAAQLTLLFLSFQI